MNDNDTEETAEAGGWSVCPICGAVIADIATHILYHEQVVVDVVVEVVNELIEQLKTPELAELHDAEESAA